MAKFRRENVAIIDQPSYSLNVDSQYYIIVMAFIDFLMSLFTKNHGSYIKIVYHNYE